ncbi:peptidoglycan-binding domain-containing protein [Micromonospora sp. LH3U1]|uniref:peptidoglycan-binding domain-containing protein n=1 Tax=Micromonospora sp. LH3U1 TaxID=3018339 RepID=UPI00234BE508|nr:peptidoglycan-binding domain-containing protein [Micromonospora sp. LH3U1]WCN84184.1 peptidoglycan-binding domain-containing protein [Micromonospora sp. LH3U1]
MPIHQNRTGRRSAAAVLLTVLASAGLAALTPTAAQAASTCTSLTYYRVGGYPGGADMHVPTVGWQDGNKTCYLEYGHSNSAVKVLQEALNNCYSQSLRLDGQYGTNTRNAVRAAQRRINQDYVYAHIAEDGEYGPQTRAYMGFAIFGVNGGPVIPNVCYYPG